MENVAKRIVKISLSLIFGGMFVFSFFGNFVNAQGSRFDESMLRAIEPIEQHLEKAPAQSLEGGAVTIQNFIIHKVMDIVVPIFILLGIMIAIFGFYSIMFGGGKGDIKRGILFIVYGMLGILFIMSAQYLTDVVVGQIMKGGIGGPGFDWVGVDVAKTLYDKVAYPFMKLFAYIVLGIMFIVLGMNVFKYITSMGDEMKKQSVTMIIWTLISMFVIIGSKELVEAVYGKQQEVLNQSAQTLGKIGPGFFADKNIPIVYNVINWVLGLSAFIILILIIYQSFLLLTKPDDAEQLTKIKKSLLYIFAGIIVIGAGYIIVNFLIVN